MVKKRQPQKVKKANLKKCLVVFGIILIFFLGGKLILSYRKSIWKEGRFNFVLASRPVLVFSLSDKEKSLTVVKIPENTYIGVARGFGLYRAESVYPLGELEGKGGQLLQETIQEFLAVPVEGWVKISSKFKVQSSKLSREDILSFKKQITSLGIFLRPKSVIKFLKEDLKTNLTLWDLAKIWLRAKRVRSSKINLIDLEAAGVLREFSLPDGQVGKKGDSLLIDNLLQEFFFEPELRREKISVEVFNGTDSQGLAHQAARIISNLGGKVSKVGDIKERLKRCQIKAGEKTFGSLTFLKIKKIFNCQVLKQEQEGLSLIIGEDYQEKLFSKE